MEANGFAYFALLSWPVVALWLYRSRPLCQAILWTILGAQLLLPVRTAIDIEMIPSIDKWSVATISALAGCLLFARSRPHIAHQIRLTKILIPIYFVSPAITSLLNDD